MPRRRPRPALARLPLAAAALALLAGACDEVARPDDDLADADTLEAPPDADAGDGAPGDGDAAGDLPDADALSDSSHDLDTTPGELAPCCGPGCAEPDERCGTGAACAIEGVWCDEATPDSPDGTLTCVQYPSGDGACRATCLTHADCPPGHTCRDERPAPQPAWCQPTTCTSFFGLECGIGSKCQMGLEGPVCVEHGTAAPGESCSGHEACDAALLCIEGACVRAECDAMGQGTVCPVAQLCSLPDEVALAGLCDNGCDPFAQVSECEPGWRCSPYGRDPASGIVTGYCERSEADGAVGESCAQDTWCLGGLACVEGICVAACDPLAEGGEANACPAGELCVSSTSVGPDFGGCTASCQPWGPPEASGCDPALESCLAVNQREAPGGSLLGLCQPRGGLSEGEPCADDFSCGAQLLCVGTCRPLCDPLSALTAEGECAVGNACVGLWLSDFSAPGQIGVCLPGCTPWTEPGDSGCAAGQWCVASQLTAGAGYCETSGAAGEGEPCQQQPCVAGLVCLGDGVCHRVCDPLAPACPSGQGCGAPAPVLADAPCTSDADCPLSAGTAVCGPDGLCVVQTFLGFCQ